MKKKSNKIYKNYLNKEFFFSLLFISLFFLITIIISFIFSYKSQKRARTEKAELISENIAESMSSKFNLINKVFLDCYFVEEFFTLQDNLSVSNEDSKYNMISYFSEFIDPTISSIIGAGYIPRIDGDLKSDNTVLHGLLDNRIVFGDDFKEFTSTIIAESLKDENKKGKCFIINHSLDEQSSYLVFCRNLTDIRKDSYNKKLGIGLIIVNEVSFLSPLSLSNSIDSFQVYITNGKNSLFSINNDEYYKENKNCLFYYKQALNYNNLYIETFCNYNGLLSDKTNSIPNKLLIYFAIVISFILFYSYWYKKSTKSLNYLFMNFKAQKNKMEMEKISFLKSDNEVNVVIDAYNSLVITVNELNKTVTEQMKNNADLEIKNKNFELDVLHSQINRHFIINVLTVIHSLINLNDIEKANYCLECLSDYLRYSLSFNVKDTELRNELKFVKSYVNLQLVRYENVFVSYSVDEKLLDYKVPKMILQPLFENAFVHGLKMKSGSISLNIYFENEFLYASVSNNHSTINYKEVEEINKMIVNDNMSIENKNCHHGIALRNIYKRLNLFYKNNSIVYLEKKDDITYSIIKIKVGEFNA